MKTTRNTGRVLALIAAAIMSFSLPGHPANAQFVNRAAARWYGGAAAYGAGIQYGAGYGATTAAESYQRGMADVIRAQGEAAESAARAARDRELARSQHIENQTKWLEEYNRRKRIGLAERDREQKERREASNRARHARNARRAEPPPTTQLDPDTGEIIWPELLQSDEYKPEREQVEELFRASKESGSSSPADSEVSQVIDVIRRTLKSHIHDVPAHKFIEADRFLKTLRKSGLSTT